MCEPFSPKNTKRKQMVQKNCKNKFPKKFLKSFRISSETCFLRERSFASYLHAISDTQNINSNCNKKLRTMTMLG